MSFERLYDTTFDGTMRLLHHTIKCMLPLRCSTVGIEPPSSAPVMYIDSSKQHIEWYLRLFLLFPLTCSHDCLNQSIALTLSTKHEGHFFVRSGQPPMIAYLPPLPVHFGTKNRYRVSLRSVPDARPQPAYDQNIVESRRFATSTSVCLAIIPRIPLQSSTYRSPHTQGLLTLYSRVPLTLISFRHPSQSLRRVGTTFAQHTPPLPPQQGLNVRKGDRELRASGDDWHSVMINVLLCARPVVYKKPQARKHINIGSATKSNERKNACTQLSAHHNVGATFLLERQGAESNTRACSSTFPDREIPRRERPYLGTTHL